MNATKILVLLIIISSIHLVGSMDKQRSQIVAPDSDLSDAEVEVWPFSSSDGVIVNEDGEVVQEDGIEIYTNTDEKENDSDKSELEKLEICCECFGDSE